MAETDTLECPGVRVASRVRGLARSASLDPVSLLGQAGRIGAALAEPGAEQAARPAAAERLRIASLAIILSMIANAIGTALFVFRPLERQIVAARYEIEARRRTAERANQAKTEFLATMSHEIRTPTNGVLGVTDLLRASRLDASQREMTEVIARSGRALIQIVDGVLDLAKIESGRLALSCEPFDLRAVAADVTALFAGAAASKDVDVRLEVDARLPTRRVGDAGAVRQMLPNLVGNPVKFFDDGEVVLRLAPDDETGVAISVRDTGIGVPPEAQTTIVECFAQADSSIPRRHGGTGLGLAIMRRLAEAMGGAVNVESAPGSGSKFTLRLALPAAFEAPTAVSRRRSPPAEAVGAASIAGLRVLVAEDNAVNQMVFRAPLDWLGCDATLVGDGAEAVAVSARDALDVIPDGHLDARPRRPRRDTRRSRARDGFQGRRAH